MQRACVHTGLWNILLSSLPLNKGMSERQAERESEEPWDKKKEPRFPECC